MASAPVGGSLLKNLEAETHLCKPIISLAAPFPPLDVGNAAVKGEEQEGKTPYLTLPPFSLWPFVPGDNYL